MTYVNSVSVYPKTITLQVGTWFYDAYAEICPPHADCKEVRWHSDNACVASVNESSGYIYGNAVGTATIYATATDGSGCSDCLTVTVQNTVPVTSVTLSNSTIYVEEGETYPIFTSVLPENASNKSLNWTSSNNSIATVSDGVVTAVSQGTATITATAQDGSGKSAHCTVNVTKNILVSSIRVEPEEISMNVDEWEILHVTVEPENATNQTVEWSSDNPYVATVVPESGIVHTMEKGSTVIRATAQDGSGVVGTCNITVNLLVQEIALGNTSIELHVGESYTLNAAVFPSNASNKKLHWYSDKPHIASVDDTGKITAKAVGSTLIFVEAKDGSGVSSVCGVTVKQKVVVDPREKVTIKKDSHSFYVEFADGKIWKNIGIDLSKREENYNSLWPPYMYYENYDFLIKEEQRYFDNIYREDQSPKSYSISQIAYLYLLDPLGVEYYMKNNVFDAKDLTLEEELLYKDEVYEAIFGNSERNNNRFFFTVVDGNPRYGKYAGYNRNDVYSNAEVLFDFHTIINWDWGEFIKSILGGLFEWVMEDSIIGQGLQAYQALFHAGGILGACSNKASSFVADYIEAEIDSYIQNKFGDKAKKMCNWGLTLIGILASSALSAFEIPNPQDITIYNQVYANPNFLTIIDGLDGEWSIKDIIDKVYQN